MSKGIKTAYDFCKLNTFHPKLYQSFTNIIYRLDLTTKMNVFVKIFGFRIRKTDIFHNFTKVPYMSAYKFSKCTLLHLNIIIKNLSNQIEPDPVGKLSAEIMADEADLPRANQNGTTGVGPTMAVQDIDGNGC